MRKERHEPPQRRPGLLDKIQLAYSTGRQVEGIWVGSWRTPEDLSRVESALLLVKQHSPVHFCRIIRDLDRVWIFLVPHGLAGYDHALKTCVLDERYVADPATRVEQIASTIVHEATHARLERWGIGYDEERRARIEAICFRRELALAVRLPDSAQLQEDIAQTLNWYQSNPDYFHDIQAHDRDANGEVEMLRHVGAPEWFIRTMPTMRSLLRRARRLFRIA